MRRFWAVFALLLFFGLRSQAQDVRVVYNVESVYNGQYTSHVMITNMTDHDLTDWKMTFLFDQEITNIEHVWSNSDVAGSYEVRGQGWTRTIKPGEIAWFTITGIAYDPETPETPRNCFFNDVGCSVVIHPESQQEFAQAHEMIVSAWIEEYDFTTYRGFFVVQNPTEYEFPAPWRLQFSTPSQMMDIENVNWRRSGTEYEVEGHGGTDLVRANDFVLIPFRGVHTGLIPQLPSNCRLNGTACSFQPPDRLVDTPRLEVKIVMAELSETEWEGYIKIDNPTQNELRGWVLRFGTENFLSEAEGMIVERAEGIVTIRPEFGRGRILQESDYVFAIRGFWSDSLKAPQGCTLNSVPCRLKFQIQQDVDEDDDGGGDSGSTGGGDDTGGTGGDPTVTCDSPGTGVPQLPVIDFRFLRPLSPYVGFIDMTNTGPGVIKGWALEFKLVDGMTVDDIWPAEWEFIGGNYRVTSVDENHCILPGETKRISIRGTHDGRFGEPIGCNFGGNICVFQKISSVGTEEDDVYLPEDSASLHPAYPNPFNPQSRISFDVPVTQSVRVELWDALGRKRRLLYDGYAQAGISHGVQIDGSSLASGMYFVRLVPENGIVQTQTIILQK